MPLDLLQVDFLASGVSLFWPRSGTFHCEAADRKQRSRERLNCLACRVFICISCQKWGVAWLAFGVSGFICESLTSMAECPDSTLTKSIERVCVSPSSKEQICLLCAKVVSNSDFRPKVDDLRRPENNKNLSHPWVNTGKGDLQWLFFN